MGLEDGVIVAEAKACGVVSWSRAGNCCTQWGTSLGNNRGEELWWGWSTRCCPQLWSWSSGRQRCQYLETCARQQSKWCLARVQLCPWLVRHQQEAWLHASPWSWVGLGSVTVVSWPPTSFLIAQVTVLLMWSSGDALVNACHCVVPAATVGCLRQVQERWPKPLHQWHCILSGSDGLVMTYPLFRASWLASVEWLVLAMFPPLALRLGPRTVFGCSSHWEQNLFPFMGRLGCCLVLFGCRGHWDWSVFLWSFHLRLYLWLAFLCLCLRLGLSWHWDGEHYCCNCLSQPSSTQPTAPQEYSGGEADRVWPGAYHIIPPFLILSGPCPPWPSTAARLDPWP